MVRMGSGVSVGRHGLEKQIKATVNIVQTELVKKSLLLDTNFELTKSYKLNEDTISKLGKIYANFTEDDIK